MYAITINNTKTIHKTNISINNGLFEGELNSNLISGSFIKINPYQFHILFNNKSYNVDVVKLNTEDKTMVVKINAIKFNLQLKDKYDELLHNLGLDNLATKKIADIKAPMPGMVLNVLVKEGDSVKKGDTLIILEAMKMENSLKSPTDGVIKKIIAIKGTAVEKNQLLIQF
jgi:biotin carboxyl carrier protein